jgi:hypothetical protein
VNENKDKQSATADPTKANSISTGKSPLKEKLDIPTSIIMRTIENNVATMTLKNPIDGQNRSKKNKDMKNTRNGVAIKRRSKPTITSLPKGPADEAIRTSLFQPSLSVS